MSNGATTHNR